MKWHRYGLAPSGPVCDGISWKSKDQGTRKGTGGSSATLTSSDLKSDGDPTDASQKSLASAERCERSGFRTSRAKMSAGV